MSGYSKSVVATGHELVSQAAADILRCDGNAFDAAVAAGFAGAVATNGIYVHTGFHKVVG